MTPTADPTKDPKWRPLSMPMPGGQPSPNEANSLWRSGSRAFFKDQRAAQVGDIVTVLVNMNDAANLKNVTSTARTSAETGGMPNFFGLEKLVPAVINPATLVTTNSTNNNIGTGQIQRTEAVTLRLAGIVTQVLPNGNLVVAASQEFLVNSELRELRGHRRDPSTGHRVRQHCAARSYGRSPDRLWRQGATDGSATSPMGSADVGYSGAVLNHRSSTGMCPA